VEVCGVVGAGLAGGADGLFAGVVLGASPLEPVAAGTTGAAGAGTDAGAGLGTGVAAIVVGTAGVSASRTGERLNVTCGLSSGAFARRSASATSAATGSSAGDADGLAGFAGEGGGAATRGGAAGCDSRPKRSSRTEFPASAVDQKYPAAHVDATSASTRTIRPGGTRPLSPTEVTT
jgi:hypothetical protein